MQWATFAAVSTVDHSFSPPVNPLDERALFERLHEMYWSILYTIACRKIGDQDEAYDLVQELFVELWEKRGLYALERLTLPWLKKRLWFKLMTYFRQRGFDQQHLKNFRDFTVRNNLDTETQPHENGTEAQFAMIMEAISLTAAGMPERMQEIFLLKQEHNFSISEIAHRLNLSPHTVRNHLQAAMKRIRITLEDQQLNLASYGIACWIVLG